MNGASQKSANKETGEPIMLAIATLSYLKSALGEEEQEGEREWGLQCQTNGFSGIFL